MQNQIIPSVFQFQSNEVRTVAKSGEPWFVAADVGTALCIKNVRQVVENLDEDEKGVCNIYTPGGNQEMTIINESGLYSLIFRSRKPEALKFTKWVTSEVLPAIRKTGKYSVKTNDVVSTIQNIDAYSDEAKAEFMKMLWFFDQLNPSWSFSSQRALVDKAIYLCSERLEELLSKQTTKDN